MLITNEEKPTRCRDGLLICKNCGNGLCHIPTDITEFKFAVLCACGELSSFEGIHIGTEEGDALVCEDGHYKCENCGRVVFSTNRHFVVNAGFQIRCSCGKVYNKSEKR